MQPGYAPPAYMYGYYGWPPVPAAPKRDGYLFGVGIAAFVCACLATLGGLVCFVFFFLAMLAMNLNTSVSEPSATFGGLMLFLALGVAGVVGGGVSIYHSARAAFMRKPSIPARLPAFWIFLVAYLVVLGIGYLLHTQGQDVTSLPLTGFLIFLAALFPGLILLSLALRLLRSPDGRVRATTWRRMALALVSGATLAIVLASVLELIAELFMLGTQTNLFQSLLSSNTVSSNPSLNVILFISLAVVAPLVEESVKPLAVVLLIGRVRSKAEAFALGMACGIGFSLIETVGYISQGYDNWLNVALVRSGAGLLHGLGAAMVAVGWYCLTHKEEGNWSRRILLAVACGGYAVLQHAIWNGTAGLVLLPGPLGTFAQTWFVNLGSLSIDGPTLLNIVEMVGILIFFLIMARRVHLKRSATTGTLVSPDVLPAAPASSPAQ
jgi:RsiW-degrading membrane proteinase PrsW (M82 family)